MTAASGESGIALLLAAWAEPTADGMHRLIVADVGAGTKARVRETVRRLEAGEGPAHLAAARLALEVAAEAKAAHEEECGAVPLALELRTPDPALATAPGEVTGDGARDLHGLAAAAGILLSVALSADLEAAPEW